jgi:hypothetical protein
MSLLRDLEIYGRPWRVSQPLTSSLDIPIVTPEDFLLGPENIGGQPSVTRRGGITILGVSASILANASGAASVTLRSQDAMYLSGQVNDYDIWGLHTAVSASASQSVNECVWCLSPANYRTSPQGSGAILELVTSANIAAGFITVWGIYGQADIGGKKSFSGSPCDWNE